MKTRSLQIVSVILFIMLVVTTSVQAGTKTSVSTGGWNTPATWSPGGVPAVGDDVIIAGGFTVTVDVNTLALLSLTINSGSTLAGSGAFTVSSTTITVNGTYTNASTGAITVANWAVGSTGTYNHNTTVAAFPRGSTTSTWDAASNFNINGLVGAVNTTNFIGQSFGNVTYNCTGQTGSVDLCPANGTVTIKGNFTMVSSGSTATVFFRLTGVIFTPIINIQGDFIMQGGRLDLNNDGGTGLPSTVNLSGNFNMSGGTLLQSTTIALATSAINFIKAGTQTFTKTGGTISSTTTAGNGIVFNVASGATLDMGTSVLDGTNLTSFNLSSGAGLITANTGGISSTGATGSIQVAGARTFSTTANYTYNGSSAQVTGTGLPSQVNNVTISNSFGVTFSAAEVINGILSVGASGKANLGSFTSYAVSLSLGGSSQSTGTYGSTSSSATNKNDTYWAGTGLVSVGAIPPANLSYTSPNAFINGTLITPLNPTVTGTVVSYSVLPALPTGLSLNTTTGQISGTPTVNTASATYTVTATNTGGSATFGVVISVGVNRYAVASGAWNVTTTWAATSGGTAGVSVPVAGDIVFIAEAAIARTVTIPSSYNALCSGLNIGGANAAGGLTFSGSTSTLTAGSYLIMNKPTANNITSTITLGAGTLTVNGNVQMARVVTASNTTSRINSITISTGTMTVGGNLTFSGTAAQHNQIIFSGAGTLNLGGLFTATLGTLTPSIGTVNFNGAAQTVTDVSSISYNNLTLSGSGIKTLVAATTALTGNLAISGTATATTAANLTIAGTLTVGTGTTFATGTNFTLGVTGATSVTGTLTLAGTGTKTFTGDVAVNALGVWNETGIAAINFAGNLQHEGATFTALSGIHTFTGAAKTISGAGEIPIPNVTVTSPGTYTNSGTLTVRTALAGTGSLTNGNGTTGTLNLGGTSAITTFAATATGNTVNYTGAAQTIRNNNYYHLTLSGSGTDVLQTGTTAVGGNLTLSGTVGTTTVANLAVTGTLTIGSGTTFATGANFTLGVTGASSITGTLTLAGTGAKTFTGDVAINAGGIWNETGIAAINYAGSLLHNGTTFTANSGTHTFSGATKTISGSGIISIPNAAVTGTYTNINTLTVGTALTGAGTLTNGNGTTGTLNLGGTSTITTLTATTTNNLVNYTGDVQTVKPTSFYNLTLSGTGSKTTTSVTVNNILSMEGTTAAASVLPTYGSSAILQYKGSAAQVAGAEFPASITGGQLAGIRIENTLGVTLNAAKDIGARYLTIGSLVSNSAFNDGGYLLTATGTLNLTSGTFTLGTATATTFPAFSTRNISDGTTVNYAATAAQTVKGITYSNLTISGTGSNSKTADGDITVNGILNLSSANASATHGCLEMVTAYGSYPGTGTPNTGPYTKAEITSYTLTMGASATTTGTGDVTGKIQRNTIVANTPYSFGQQFTTVTFSGGTMPTPVSVVITIGTASLGKTAGLQRTYEIIPTGGSGGTVAANFHYLPSEIQANTESKMVTFDYDIGGGSATPDEHGRSVYDITTNHYIGLSNIPLSYFQQSHRTIFTMGDATEGVETWLLTAASTDWTAGTNWSSGHAPLTTDHVIIPGPSATHYPILPSGGVTINSISFGDGGSLDLGSNTLTIQNSLSGGWDDQNAAGNDPGTSTVIFSMPGTTISGNARFYNVSISDGADITNEAGSTMKIAGTISKTGSGTGKWYADTYGASIEYNGGDQTVLLPDGTPQYHNLTISGSGTKTMPASAMTMHGNFTTGGTASATAAGALTVAGNVTLGSGTFAGSSYTHNVAGNWTNNGATFTPSTGTINFNSTTAAQTINGSATTQTFNNITVVKTAQTLSVGGSTTTLTMNGGLTLTSGTFDVGTAATVNVAGNWSNSGTFTHNNGIVNFNGGSAQTILGTNSNAFYDLTINNTGGVSVTTADQTVNHTLTLTSANASSTQGALGMLNNHILFMGASATTAGTGDVSGYINRTSFVLGTDYTFGNPNTKMNFTVGPLPTSVTLEVYLTSAKPSWMASYTGIWRYYDVTQSGGAEATRLRFNAHYLNSELQGATGVNLDFYDYHLSGTYAGQTHDHGRSDNITNSDPNNWVGFSNVGLVFLGVATHDDHLWTLGNNITGNACTWIGGSPSGPTDWNLPGNWEGGVPTSVSDVHIPAATYAPLLTEGSTTIVSIEIQSGGILNANTGTPTLTVSGGTGAWANLGAFNAGTSTIAFTGTDPTMAGSTVFYNVSIADGKTLTLLTDNVMSIEGALTLGTSAVLNAASNPNTIEYAGSGQTITNPNGSPAGFYSLTASGSSASASGALSAKGNFEITGSGAFTAGAYTHTITGDFTNDGTFTGTGSTILLNGATASQAIAGTSATTFNNLSIDNSFGVSLTSSALTTVAGTLLINSGKLFGVDAGKQLTVGTLTNNAGTAGLFIHSNATGTGSLINTTASVQGTVERYIPNNNAWHLLSAPVSAQPIWPGFAPTPSGDPLTFGTAPWNWDFYYWNPNASETNQLYWVNLRQTDAGLYNARTVDVTGSEAGFGAATPNFTVGRGYLTAYNANWYVATGSPTTHLFTGDLNAGTYSVSVTNGVNSWNLVGNPFPSSIDWRAASGWTRSNLVQNGAGSGYYDMWIYNEEAGNYGICNSAPAGLTTNSVTNNIAPMQGFFVKASSSANIGMTTSVQTHSSQPWLKSGEDFDNSLRLSLNTSANNFSDEMIVAVNADYTNSGSEKFWSMYSEAPELYSIKNGVNYSIDRLPSVNENSVVALGIKAGVDAVYTFKATGVGNFFISKSIILEDLKTGITQELKDNPIYAFTAKPGDNAERFHLHFGSPDGMNEHGTQPDFTIFSYNNSVYVNNISGKDLNGSIYISDILGRKISQAGITDKATVISIDAPSGCYIVTVVTNNQTYSRKVVLH